MCFYFFQSFSVQYSNFRDICPHIVPKSLRPMPTPAVGTAHCRPVSTSGKLFSSPMQYGAKAELDAGPACASGAQGSRSSTTSWASYQSTDDDPLRPRRSAVGRLKIGNISHGFPLDLIQVTQIRESNLLAAEPSDVISNFRSGSGLDKRPSFRRLARSTRTDQASLGDPRRGAPYWKAACRN